jgi:non-canonical poly(A) RNA polymerase PAPD5/7
VEAFVNYVSPTPVEDEVRSLVVEIVSKAVTQAFPDAEVKPFGSFGTKLYLPRGYVPVYPIDYLLIYDTTL